MQRMQNAPSSRVQRKPGEIGFTLLVILFGCLGYYFAMDISSGEYSSPSVAPKVASSIIIIMGILSLAQTLKKQAIPFSPDVLIRYLFTWDVLFVLAMLGLYSYALPALHFPLASFIFLLVTLFYLQRFKRPVLCLLIAGASVGVLVGIFKYIFKVMLP